MACYVKYLRETFDNTFEAFEALVVDLFDDSYKFSYSYAKLGKKRVRHPYDRLALGGTGI